MELQEHIGELIKAKKPQRKELKIYINGFPMFMMKKFWLLVKNINNKGEKICIKSLDMQAVWCINPPLNFTKNKKKIVRKGD